MALSLPVTFFFFGHSGASFERESICDVRSTAGVLLLTSNTCAVGRTIHVIARWRLRAHCLLREMGNDECGTHLEGIAVIADSALQKCSHVVLTVNWSDGRISRVDDRI
ncbi:hypothetical protein EDD17DRAFT_1216332 [Pisolithus thermaeus]|nr:hypothetical protein EDD17DRAFT_1216332 [Pisolithus thermaeus]